MSVDFKKVADALSSLFGSKPDLVGDDNYRYTPELAARAEAGDRVAQSALGTAYHEGLGVPQSPELAFRWFFAAASQGHAGAQLMVAASYDVGKVVGVDLVEAGYWAKLSRDGGNELGAIFLDSILSKLTETQRQQLAARINERNSGR